MQTYTTQTSDFAKATWLLKNGVTVAVFVGASHAEEAVRVADFLDRDDSDDSEEAIAEAVFLERRMD